MKPNYNMAFAYYVNISLLSGSPEGHRIVACIMSKTEIFLLIILAVILLGSIWFIFSDEIWLLLCYLESQIYPTFSVPQ